jgi:DNA ligase-1
MISIKDLVELSRRVGSTTKKKEKVSLLADFFRRAKGEEIALAARYLSGQLPQGRLGIGWATLQEVLHDLPVPLRSPSLIEMDRLLEGISREKGGGSSERKVGLLRDLFSSLRQEEKEFLTGLILGEVRQGALEGVALEAIAQASSLPVDRLRQSLMFSGDIGEVAQVALEEGIAGLSHFQPRLFHPLSPMLANPVEGEAEALERLGEAGFEFKIDGARIQVHKEKEEVRIFTRHLKDITDSIPEIVELARTFQFENAIFEGEAIALREDGKPLPFQITMRRFGRILDVQRLEKEIPLTPYFFDLLYFDGESLFHKPYQDRFELLSQKVPSAYMIRQMITGNEKEVEDFLRRSLESGHEGLMAKGLNSPYVAGHRGYTWLKIKPARTLDLVVLAAEWGHGRRREWLSNLHLGARDLESGNFVMLGKTFKGLTDKMLHWQTKKLLGLEVSRDQWTVYVKPELVVEVAFNEIQESPRYPGGLALRFARVKNFRTDKSPLEADTIQKIGQLFEAKRK